MWQRVPQLAGTLCCGGGEYFLVSVSDLLALIAWPLCPSSGPGSAAPSPLPRAGHALEFLDPGQHAQVLVVAQVHVIPARVPGVEGVEADHVESLHEEKG